MVGALYALGGLFFVGGVATATVGIFAGGMSDNPSDSGGSIVRPGLWAAAAGATLMGVAYFAS